MRPAIAYLRWSVLIQFALLPAAAPAQSRPAAHDRPTTASAPAIRPHNFAKWEKQIAAFEASDRSRAPQPGGVLFLGSSTIRRWATLTEDFPRQIVVNRGFGGSQIIDSTHFAERIIFPYRPRQIFLRAGGNDITAGKSPEEVLNDYKQFVATVHARLPETRIVFISISPSPSNRARWDEFRELNRLIEAYSRGEPRLDYLETFDMVVGPDGQPRAELFVADRLHMNAEGYRLLAARVRKFLPNGTPATQPRPKH